MNEVALYARYSCDQQRETSIEDQLRRCREVAQRHGFNTDDALIYADEALSGTAKHDSKRQGYHALIAAWEAGRFKVLVVDEFSRLTRDILEQASLVKRLENNMRVRLITANGIDSSLETWQLQVGLVGLVGQQAGRDTKHRVVRGMVGQLERGYMIATPPFGYDFKRELDGQGNRIGTHWVINETEAPVVREVFARREAGGSMHQIARWLNDTGVPCARAARNTDGGYWRPSRIRNLLSNRIYCGEFIWNDSSSLRNRASKQGRELKSVSFARPHLRLVSDETWSRCSTNSVSRTGYGGGKNALAGLITCGCCGSTLSLTAERLGRSVFCANCTVAKSADRQTERQTISVLAAGVEILLTAALRHFLTPQFVDAFRASLRSKLCGDATRDIEVCRAELAKSLRAQDRLSRMIAISDIDDPVLVTRYEETRDSVRETQARMGSLEAGMTRVDRAAVEAQLRADPAVLLEGLFDADVPPERLRAVLARLFPSIVLLGKEGRYKSFFSISFAAGAALAMVSQTETVDEGSVELRFQLRFKPDNRSVRKTECKWRVTQVALNPAQNEGGVEKPRGKIARPPKPAAISVS